MLHRRRRSAHKQACIWLFHGKVKKLQEEMGRDKNRGLTQAELSDWIKRSAWQSGRLPLARCSCHPLATHLAQKTLAQQSLAACLGGHMWLPGDLFVSFHHFSNLPKIEGNAERNLSNYHMQ